MLKQGSIIRALVQDPQGGNPKIRPLIVLTPTSEIDDKQPIAVVAVTGRFSDPLCDDEVALPFHPGGEAATKLRKPSVAKCSWQEAIQITDIVDIKGFVSDRVLAVILAKVIGLSEVETGKGQQESEI